MRAFLLKIFVITLQNPVHTIDIQFDLNRYILGSSCRSERALMKQSRCFGCRFPLLVSGAKRSRGYRINRNLTSWISHTAQNIAGLYPCMLTF